MADETKIEWADSTLNPWIGCTKIAPACDHCYAADWSKRYGRAEWGNHPRQRTNEATWNAARKWQVGAAAFQAEHGRRRRVFCASLADVFDNQVPPEWRDDLWALIRECPDLDWLLLTKRPQNIESMLPAFWDEIKGHIWLGTTVEDQEHADRNIPHLLKHDAAVRFISAEPLLGAIDLRHIGGKLDALTGAELMSVASTNAALQHDVGTYWMPMHRRIDWVIAGGESGPHARPSHWKWFRSLRDQCAIARVSFLLKQHGEWASVCDMTEDLVEKCYPLKSRRHPDATRRPKVEVTVMHIDGSLHDSAPDAAAFSGRYPMQMFKCGKVAAGRLLDGVEHNGFPEVRH